MNERPSVLAYDLKQAVTSNRLAGLWRMLAGYRGLFVAATVAVGVSAAARTAFYYLLRFFADDVLGQAAKVDWLLWVALGFIGLALVQGLFTFLSGRWAAAAAEGITLRLRDYLYDHIQRLAFS